MKGTQGARSNRDLETRRAEERMNELRGGMYTLQNGPLDIPPEWVPEGWVYVWGRAALNGEPDNNRLAQLASQGWTHVPVDRHPQLMQFGISFRNEYLTGYVHRGGLMLFERPLEWDRMQTQKLNDYTYRIINSLAAVAPSMFNPVLQSSTEIRQPLPVTDIAW